MYNQEYIRDKSAQPPIPPWYNRFLKWHSNVSRVNMSTVLIADELNCMSASVVIIHLAKFTDDQYTTINQSTAGRFDPRVFVNCLQVDKVPRVETSCSWLINSCVLLISEFHYFQRNYEPLQYYYTSTYLGNEYSCIA